MQIFINIFFSCIFLLTKKCCIRSRRTSKSVGGDGIFFSFFIAYIFFAVLRELAELADVNVVSLSELSCCQNPLILEKM